MTVATKVGGDDGQLVLGDGVERWIGERFHVGQGGRSISYIGEMFMHLCSDKFFKLCPSQLSCDLAATCIFL